MSERLTSPDQAQIAVIGLGYVGLPLAVEFGRSHSVVGYDISKPRIKELLENQDSTGELSSEEIRTAAHLTFSCDPADLKGRDVFIVTVPTPVDKQKQPDMRALQAASKLVGEVLDKGNIVIFESTVFPGASEEICAPILEAASGLVLNRDFFLGYSPERINPGDKSRRLPDITKVTSGSTDQAAEFVAELYGRIIPAGIHKAPSIKVAEAAKVIENTQRDLNIALVNELAVIFNRLGIDTLEVLEAAGTKWNFLPFRPGLVGGHCIGVDPFYLTHKAQESGYHPEVVLAGRRINDQMGQYIAGQAIRLMICRDMAIKRARVLVLGLTFKEDCPDLRNSGVWPMIEELQTYQMAVDVCDPLADPVEAEREYGLSLTDAPEEGAYDLVILAVKHAEFLEHGAQALRGFGKETHIFLDIKGAFDKEKSDWRL